MLCNCIIWVHSNDSGSLDATQAANQMVFQMDFFVISVTHLFETTLAEETEGFVNSFFRVLYGILPT